MPRHEGHRRRRRVHAAPTQRRAQVQVGELEGAGAADRAAQVQRRRGALHHHLRPPVLTDVAVGPRGRWPDERPADRHASSPICSSIQLTPEAGAGRGHEGARATTKARSRRTQARATASCCSTCRRRAAPTRAPAATPTGGPTTSRVVSGGGAMGPNLTGGSEGRQFPSEDRSERVRRTTAPTRASATASRGRARAACRASARSTQRRADRGGRRRTSGDSDGSGHGVFADTGLRVAARDPRHRRRADRGRRADGRRCTCCSATDLGARLGLLVALGALFGWLTILASMWWIYGIGLKGADPTWKPVEVIVGDISNQRTTQIAPTIARRLGEARRPTIRAAARRSAAADDDPRRTAVQASSRARPTTSSPTCTRSAAATLSEVGFFNFRHDPHYALVQVQPVQAARSPRPASHRRHRSPTRRSRVVSVADGARPRLPAAARGV